MSSRDSDYEPYNEDEVADAFEAMNFVGDTDNSAFELASSVYTASHILGHNNKQLREAVLVAQQLVGDTMEIDLTADKSVDVDEARANRYIQQVRDKSKVALSQAKLMNKDVDTFKKIDKLLNSISGTDYKRLVL